MASLKNIAIYGFGKEGISAANYLGKTANISIIEDRVENEIDKSNFKKLKIKNAQLYFGKNFPKDHKFDLLVRSPGFRPDHPKITHFTNKKVQLTSPTNIFFENCKAPIIGVTGTKGKGTTVSLIFDLLKTQNSSVFLAGNIGTPMLEILPLLSAKSLVVLELSSFQLIDLKYSPHIAVVLMVTSEHLDWHKNQNEYLLAKKSIVKFQHKKDYAVINSDFELSKKYALETKARIYYYSVNKKTNGVYVEKNYIYSQIGNFGKICDTSKILLPGAHNLQNVAAAVSVAKILKINKNNMVKTLAHFKGLKHRLQLFREFRGVKYYNDSYSTIPETTLAAVEAIKTTKILILGGSSKHSDFSRLTNKIISDRSIKALILIGQEASRIRESIGKSKQFKGIIVENLKTMRQIVVKVAQIAKKGDAVILSPACASFDMFKNYEDRGQQFIEEVDKL